MDHKRIIYLTDRDIRYRTEKDFGIQLGRILDYIGLYWKGWSGKDMLDMESINTVCNVLSLCIEPVAYTAGG